MLPLREQLLIIPTEFERNCIQSQLNSLSDSGLCHAIAGVGLVESAVSVSRLISVYQPKQIWLVGIAGSLVDQLALGQAYEFSRVSCYGVGVGQGIGYQTPNELGWRKMMKYSDADCLELSGASADRELVSVAAASSSIDEANLKRAKFPNAGAEDMEAYSIALQCRNFGIRCRVIRGISNRAGDRNHASWKVAEAMIAAAEMCIKRIREDQ